MREATINTQCPPVALSPGHGQAAFEAGEKVDALGRLALFKVASIGRMR